jgi:hypothetical protein
MFSARAGVALAVAVGLVNGTVLAIAFTDDVANVIEVFDYELIAVHIHLHPFAVLPLRWMFSNRISFL